ncbi:hypothetical protein DEIPH_ctg011orf0205 [Deinococcus phoenicis]|uniref:phosphoenolpyruvate--glycerone phosphotransferase n=1 Tax=Deinococcus phoenicis TaxID=1476583 RepID=A0A016QTK5_9DEIO|nr:dihydroxyacetone kinase phosphoryl donor subunit DhaM [Deinococcus phoenicis]EYB69212.1 hypothetical protein DEIPH_ctg011orf0205 [Deinococcus phoenicis]
MTVALVIVSHSARLAEGVVELAGQMGGQDLSMTAVGGTEDGDLGTSAPRISRAVEAALTAGHDVLILLDLGSAAMNTALALEMLDPDQRQRVKVAQAPLVEGAVLAAVSASVGAPLGEVCAEAETAYRMPKT